MINSLSAANGSSLSRPTKKVSYLHIDHAYSAIMSMCHSAVVTRKRTRIRMIRFGSALASALGSNTSLSPAPLPRTEPACSERRMPAPARARQAKWGKATESTFKRISGTCGCEPRRWRRWMGRLTDTKAMDGEEDDGHQSDGRGKEGGKDDGHRGTARHGWLPEATWRLGRIFPGRGLGRVQRRRFGCEVAQPGSN